MVKLFVRFATDLTKHGCTFFLFISYSLARGCKTFLFISYSWTQGYKTFLFMLNSTELEIPTAHKN